MKAINYFLPKVFFGLLFFFSLSFVRAQTYTVTSLGDGGTGWASTCANATPFNSGTFTEGVRLLNSGTITKIVFDPTLSGTIDLSARSAAIQICVNNASIVGSPTVTISSTSTWMNAIEIDGNADSLKNLNFKCSVLIKGKNNYISGNTVTANVAGIEGVKLDAGATGNTVINNTITGTGNSSTGILVNAASTGNIINGNKISNFQIGIQVQSSNNNSILNNYVYSNTQKGIDVESSSNSIIQGNKVGLDQSGLVKGNGFEGIYVYGGNNHTIGGCSAGQGNIVVANGSSAPNVSSDDQGNGISVWNSGTTTSASIQGNFVGTITGAESYSGGVFLGNSMHGIYIRNTSGVAIGGTCPNTVGNNGFGKSIFPGSGIAIVGPSGVAEIANNNIIKGNYVGTDGTAAGSKIGNKLDGIVLNANDFSGTGTTQMSGNIIESNTVCNNWQGISIRWNADNNIIRKNYVGTNSSKATNLGNGQSGISLESFASGNTVGGPTAADGNRVSGNGQSFKYNATNNPAPSGVGNGIGIWVVSNDGSNGVNNNTVYNNIVGRDNAENALLSNTGNGIQVEKGAHDNYIGYFGKGNTISNNGGDGVNVNNTASVRNMIKGNSIFCNTGKGINLNYGANAGNNGIASPIITSNLTTASHIEGTAGANDSIDLYYTPTSGCVRTCSDPLKQEGKVYFASVKADATGKWQYNGALSGTVTATANNNAVAGIYNTSEFATCQILCTSSISSGPSTVCAGSTQTYSTTDVGPWTWVVTNGSINSGQGTNTISVTFSTTSPATIKLTSGACAQGTLSVTVNPNPSITSSGTGTVCSGIAQNYTITSSIASSYSWSRASVSGISNAAVSNQTSNPITEALVNTTTAPVTVTYVITATSTTGSCASTAFNYSVTVNPQPTITSSSTGSVCSGVAQNYSITSSVASSYNWSRAAVAGISNAAVSNQTSNSITEALVNTTNSPITVTYVITATATTGSCTSTAFNYSVTVNPGVNITSSSTGSVCSGVPQNYTITSNVSANYSWSRASVLGISNAAVSNQTVNPITEALINTTDTPINVTYIINATATSGSCSSTNFNYSVTINPQPTITSSGTGTVCSGVGQNYVIASNVASNYSWSRATVTGISNAAVTNQTSNPITEALVNTTNAPINVTYVVTATSTSGSCSSTAFNYSVTVNPGVTITSASTGTVCSGVAQNYTITSNVAATYSWSRETVVGISNAAVSNQTTNPITEALVNTSNAPVTVTYVINATGSSGSCSSSAFNYSVTVNPGVTITSAPTSSVCSGVAQNYSITSNIAASFSWSRATVAGISNASVSNQTSNPITEALVNTTNAPINVTYDITATANTGSCTSAAFNYVVTVNPAAATVKIDGSDNFCPGATGIKFTAVDVNGNLSPSGSAYAWTVTGATMNPSPNTSNTLSIDFGTTAATITLVETTPEGCSSAQFTKTVNPNASNFAGITSNPGNNICKGDTATLTAIGPVGSTFRWFKDNVFTTETTPSIKVAVSGTYAVEVFFGVCKDTSDNKVITVNDNPDPNQTVSGSNKICLPTTNENYSIPSPAAGSTFTWTLPTGVTIATSNPPSNNSIDVDFGSNVSLGVNKIIVTEKNAANCTAPIDTFLVTVNPRPAQDSIIGPKAACDQSIGIIYNVTPNNGVDYSWTVPSDFTITSSPTNNDSIIVDVKAVGTSVPTGWVTVNRTITLTGCTNLKPDSLEIRIDKRPDTSPITGIGSVCEGTKGQVYTITPNPIHAYLTWTVTTGGEIKSGQWTNSITVDFTSGVDTVQIIAVQTDSISGCADLSPSIKKVGLHNNPSSVKIVGPASICGGGNPGKYYVENKPLSTFTWTFPNGCTQVTSASSDTLNLTFDSKIINGDISVIETNASGCSSATPTSLTISNYPYAPTSVDAGPLKEICSGGVTLSPTGYTLNGFTAHWDVIRGSASFYNADHDTTTAWNFSPDTNVVKITISGKCDYTSDTLTVVVSSKSFQVSASSAADTVCLGGSAQVMVDINGSNANPFTYSWLSSDNSVNTVTTDNQLNVNLSTAGWVYFYVIVKDKNNCMTPKTLIDSVYGVAPQALKIPNMITPNGDNLNDCWKIKDDQGVEIIPGSLLEIYNRWGERVYKNEKYQNGDFCGAILADGVYYYYLKPTCGIKSEEKGWLHIISNTEESSNR